MTFDPWAVLASVRVVPVVSEDDPSKATQLADALLAGGLPIVEVTFRQAGAVEALRAVASRGDVFPIAGTILSADQVDEAIDAGAQLIVSPGFCSRVVERARQLGAPVCPGVVTPTEVQAALAEGLRVLKFFPAEASGGIAMLRALAAPFPSVRFLPTGGISEENLESYLRIDSVIACGGSWMVKPSLYADGDFHRVAEVARRTVRLAASAGRKTP